MTAKLQLSHWQHLLKGERGILSWLFWSPGSVLTVCLSVILSCCSIIRAKNTLMSVLNTQPKVMWIRTSCDAETEALLPYFQNFCCLSKIQYWGREKTPHTHPSKHCWDITGEAKGEFHIRNKKITKKLYEAHSSSCLVCLHWLEIPGLCLNEWTCIK